MSCVTVTGRSKTAQSGEETAAVDDYRRYKVKQAEERRGAIERGKPIRDEDGKPLKPLSASSVNKTIDVLQAILALAVEYGHITSNAAAGKRRRLKPPARRPVHLDTAEQIEALLGTPVYLDLRIKIAKDWQRDPKQLRRLGFYD